MQKQIQQDASILTCFLAYLKICRINIVNYKNIEKHLNKYKHLPKFEQELGSVTLDLKPIFNVFEKFKYVEKKENQLDTYYITMSTEQARKILLALKKKNEPISLNILDAFGKLYIDEEKYFTEMFPEKQPPKKTNQITTARDFFLVFCALLLEQQIYIFDEGTFKYAFGFDLGNDDTFFQFLEQLFQRKFMKEDLAKVFEKFIREGFFEFRKGLNEELDMVSCFFHMDAKFAKELLEKLEEKDAYLMQSVVNEYLGRNREDRKVS